MTQNRPMWIKDPRHKQDAYDNLSNFDSVYVSPSNRDDKDTYPWQLVGAKFQPIRKQAKWQRATLFVFTEAEKPAIEQQLRQLFQHNVIANPTPKPPKVDPKQYDATQITPSAVPNSPFRTTTETDNTKVAEYTAEDLK